MTVNVGAQQVFGPGVDPNVPQGPNAQEEVQKPDFTSVISTLAKVKAEVVVAATSNLSVAQQALAAEARQIDSAIKVLAEATAVPLAKKEEKEDLPRVVFQKNLDDDVMSKHGIRGYEGIRGTIASIPPMSVEGVLEVPKLDRRVIYRRGKFNEVYVKYEEETE